ncbi:unnamed protein product [Caenorhabditis auriculariae]|uniref:Uncharacterized protein n=1 Tax=Caenorhabditis auriculariae TaxID=2777116 RepID=A0A8S1HR02_9PELO|nr:unnamed protein product [Caenorhabditis auriculariae]
MTKNHRKRTEQLDDIVPYVNDQMVVTGIIDFESKVSEIKQKQRKTSRVERKGNRKRQGIQCRLKGVAKKAAQTDGRRKKVGNRILLVPSKFRTPSRPKRCLELGSSKKRLPLVVKNTPKNQLASIFYEEPKRESTPRYLQATEAFKRRAQSPLRQTPTLPTAPRTSVIKSADLPAPSTPHRCLDEQLRKYPTPSGLTPRFRQITFPDDVPLYSARKQKKKSVELCEASEPKHTRSSRMTPFEREEFFRRLSEPKKSQIPN